MVNLVYFYLHVFCFTFDLTALATSKLHSVLWDATDWKVFGLEISLVHCEATELKVLGCE